MQSIHFQVCYINFFFVGPFEQFLLIIILMLDGRLNLNVRSISFYSLYVSLIPILYIYMYIFAYSIRKFLRFFSHYSVLGYCNNGVTGFLYIFFFRKYCVSCAQSPFQDVSTCTLVTIDLI